MPNRLCKHIDIYVPFVIATEASCEKPDESVFRGQWGKGTYPQGMLDEAHNWTSGPIDDRDPAKFWAKLTKLLADPEVELPASAKLALLQDLPDPALEPQFRFRTQTGMGSLGKPRYVALVEWAGSWIAREAKAATLPATEWLAGHAGAVKLPEILAERSVRCADPFYRPAADWITRRLAPRCSRIDLSQLTHTPETVLLLEAMGGETANLHLADRSAAGVVLADLEKRAESWLERVAHDLAEQIEADWHEWRQSYRAV